MLRVRLHYDTFYTIPVFSSGRDLILGYSSNDNLFGKNGADFMAGGKGTDKVVAAKVMI